MLMLFHQMVTLQPARSKKQVNRNVRGKLLSIRPLRSKRFKPYRVGTSALCTALQLGNGKLESCAGQNMMVCRNSPGAVAP